MKRWRTLAVVAALSLTACDDGFRPPIGIPTEPTGARTPEPAPVGAVPRPLPEPTMSFGEAVIRSGDRSALVEAQSSPVKMGVPYLFEVGHCGLSWYTDFDGSYWRIVDKSPPGRDPTALINGDRGTMTLVSENKAVYDGSDGWSVELRRADRTWRVSFCA